jgi:multidrug efflux pump subunit AcrA (membrane-fusion protein)
MLSYRWTGFVASTALLLIGCGARPSLEPTVQAKETPQERELGPGQIRATGTIAAVKAYTALVPHLAAQTMTPQNNRLTLVKLAANGTRVKTGDVLAEFDRTQQIDAAREAKAKFEDLSHQVQQKQASNRSDAEKRSADLKEAEADLAKAEIQLRKAEVLSDIEREKNKAKAEGARARVESLKKINELRTAAEAAALRIVELQMERQKVALERAQTNAEKLLVKAPIDGMVALENIWRSGSMGNAQEGDQLWSGQPLLKIFDPGEMQARVMVGEPDGAVLKPGAVATLYLDAYPDAVFKAHFLSASPVATAALGSPIKNFTAVFRIEANDPRLLPDLSAALILQAHAGAK